MNIDVVITKQTPAGTTENETLRLDDEEELQSKIDALVNLDGVINVTIVRS